MRIIHEHSNLPNYSLAEVEQFLHLDKGIVSRWAKHKFIANPKQGLSFLNLLELHVLKGLRRGYGLSMQKIQFALDEFHLIDNVQYPLLDKRLETDGIHLFLHDGDEYLNLNKPRQRGIPGILSSYLRRIDRFDDGTPRKFYPFIVNEDVHEPKSIEIDPEISFGKPVLVNTGISTAVIAGRFRARDSITDLAEEYGVSISVIEDVIRWEMPLLNAA